MSLEITRAEYSFSDWPLLLSLLQKAFASMEGRIDPPSSLRHLTLESIATKARHESLFVATENGVLVGCVFAALQTDCLYIGKLAVHPDHQRRGIGRKLMDAVERYASDEGVGVLKLDTRIELVENHCVFESLGYLVTGKHSHEGYDRPRSFP